MGKAEYILENVDTATREKPVPIRKPAIERTSRTCVTSKTLGIPSRVREIAVIVFPIIDTITGYLSLSQIYDLTEMF